MDFPISIITINIRLYAIPTFIVKVADGPRGYRLNSAEHGLYPAHNVKMPTFFGILTFICMINSTSERNIK